MRSPLLLILASIFCCLLFVQTFAEISKDKIGAISVSKEQWLFLTTEVAAISLQHFLPDTCVEWIAAVPELLPDSSTYLINVTVNSKNEFLDVNIPQEEIRRRCRALLNAALTKLNAEISFYMNFSLDPKHDYKATIFLPSPKAKYMHDTLAYFENGNVYWKGLSGSGNEPLSTK